MEKDVFSIAQRALSVESEAIRQMADLLDEASFSEAVHKLARARRIAAAGCGHSGIACRHFAHLLCCIGLPGHFLDPSEALHGGMGYMGAGDVCVLSSRGGKTAELLPIAQYCRKEGVYLIVVTEALSSPLVEMADLALYYKVTRETDRDNLQGTTSTTLQCVLFHALQAALIEETGFSKEQFSYIHPGGAVGELLNGKQVGVLS